MEEKMEIQWVVFDVKTLLISMISMNMDANAKTCAGS